MAGGVGDVLRSLLRGDRPTSPDNMQEAENAIADLESRLGEFGMWMGKQREAQRLAASAPQAVPDIEAAVRTVLVKLLYGDRDG